MITESDYNISNKRARTGGGRKILMKKLYNLKQILKKITFLVLISQQFVLIKLFYGPLKVHNIRLWNRLIFLLKMYLLKIIITKYAVNLILISMKQTASPQSTL